VKPECSCGARRRDGLIGRGLPRLCLRLHSSAGQGRRTQQGSKQAVDAAPNLAQLCLPALAQASKQAERPGGWQTQCAAAAACSFLPLPSSRAARAAACLVGQKRERPALQVAGGAVALVLHQLAANPCLYGREALHPARPRPHAGLQACMVAAMKGPQ